MTQNVLEIRDLRLALARGARTTLLHGVDLTVGRGERVGLVGESGSGKSLLSLTTMGLQPGAIAVTGGSVRVAGTEVVGATERDLDRLRGRTMAMIYQDPMSSLNPVRTVGQQIAEVLRVHEGLNRPTAHRRAVDLLGAVGVRDPRRSVDAYPHEFSGGMRQRVMIAMAISCEPDLLLADEPTTALDVTTQARIVELLDALVTERGMGVVFVTHDLAVAAGFCDRIAVMRDGRIVEEGPAGTLLRSPQDPYTQALLESICTFETDPDQPLLSAASLAAWQQTTAKDGGR